MVDPGCLSVERKIKGFGDQLFRLGIIHLVRTQNLSKNVRARIKG